MWDASSLFPFITQALKQWKDIIFYSFPFHSTLLTIRTLDIQNTNITLGNGWVFQKAQCPEGNQNKSQVLTVPELGKGASQGRLFEAMPRRSLCSILNDGDRDE